MIPSRLRQPSPCVSSIRPSKSTSGLSPRNAQSAVWTTSPHGIRPRPKPRLTMLVLTSPLRPPPQCRAVIARSVGDPFASDDPQPRQRLLRTRAPAEASLLRIDAVVLCIATSAANLRPLPSAATHHPDGLPGQGKALASAFQPGHCSLVERRLIPLRDPGVHWGLCNASAPKATYGIDPETPQCPRLRDLHRPAADMPTGAAACQIGLRPI